MRLSKAGAARLYDLARNVERFSLRSQFIIARWMARDATAARRQYDRYFAQALRGTDDPSQTVALTKQAKQLLDGQNRLAEHICYAIHELDRELTTEASFDAICDLLGVNPVHRTTALQEFTTQRGAITTIAFIAGLEDSACFYSGRQVGEFKRGPLFTIFYASFRRDREVNPSPIDGLSEASQWIHKPAFYKRLADGSIAGRGRSEPAYFSLHEVMFRDDATHLGTHRHITKH